MSEHSANTHFRFYRRITFVAIEIALLAAFLSYRYGALPFGGITAKLNPSKPNFNSKLNSSPYNATSSSDLSEKLANEVRILCWIMTTPSNHRTRAIHVRRTWGRRCNRLLFVTSQEDEELGETLVINEVEDVYEKIWSKTRLGFEQIYHRYGDDMDWFYKADDDTYAHIENMRYMLYPYSPEMPIYFGYKFKYDGDNEQVYMSGGSGYVLSREALRRFVELAITNATNCDVEKDSLPEDFCMGRCLRGVDVIAGDSRDVNGKLRFHPFEPYTALMPNHWPADFWYFKYSYYQTHTCLDCLSKYPVAFHYVPPEEMYLYEFFAYEFQSVGPEDEVDYILPQKLSIEELVIRGSDNFIKEN